MTRLSLLKPKWWLCGVAVLGVAVLGVGAATTMAQETAPTPPASPAQLCLVQDSRVKELSGLVASRAYPGCFWAHNDSGDTARIFLLNSKGDVVAVVNLEGVTARDWEDIALAGDYLYIGDIGDNFSVMDAVQVHRLREPKLNPEKLNQEITLLASDRETMTLRYPDGAHDAETLAATPDGRLLLVSKSLQGSNFYASPAPFINRGAATMQKVASDFQFGATGYPTKLATGGELSTDGRKLVVCTYSQNYEFSLTTPFDFGTLRLDTPKISNLPPLKQCESACYSLDGKNIFVSSEGKNAPIYEMRSELG